MLKAAVIGIGNMGRHHARIYSELCELVAIADMNEENGNKISSKYNCKYYSDYKEMIDSEKIDILTIAVPNTLHKEIALDCIAKGINILIEKPIADTLENAKLIMEAAKSVKVTVGHIERFNPVVRKVKEIIDSEVLGDITSILCKRVGLFPPQIKDADVITDLGVHDIDICSYLLSKNPDKVYALHGKALATKSDYAEIILKYNGTNVVIQTNWITPIRIRKIAITGINGYLEADYVTQKIVMYKRQVGSTFDDFGDFVLKFGEPEKVEIDVEQKEPLKEEISSFISCIENNTEPEVTLQQAYDALRIAIEASEYE